MSDSGFAIFLLDAPPCFADFLSSPNFLINSAGGSFFSPGKNVSSIFPTFSNPIPSKNAARLFNAPFVANTYSLATFCLAPIRANVPEIAPLPSAAASISACATCSNLWFAPFISFKMSLSKPFFIFSVLSAIYYLLFCISSIFICSFCSFRY